MRFTIFLLITSFSLTILISGEAAAKKIVVGTKEAAPFVIENNDGTLSGISIDLWKEIARELNLEYELRTYNNLEGLIKGIEKREVDVAIAALTITSDREKSFDFTHPFYTTGLSIAFTKKGRPKLFLDFLIKLFSINFLKAIAALAVILLIVGILIWFFERKHNKNQFGGNWLKGIGSGFWWSAVTMTTVGYGDKAPQTLVGRLIAVVWMFTAIIIISGFTAAIASSLTLSNLRAPIKSHEDLPDVRVGTVAGTTSEVYLKERKIDFVSYEDLNEGLHAVQAGNIDAIVYDLPIILYMIKERTFPRTL